MEILPETAKKKTLKLKWFLIPVIITLLILLGEGIYYFFFLKGGALKESKTLKEGEYVAEGSEIFRMIQGVGQLVAIQGVISEVDDDGLTITTYEKKDYQITKSEIKEILKTNVKNGEIIFDTLEESSYEEITEGWDVVFNLLSGTLLVNIIVEETAQ